MGRVETPLGYEGQPSVLVFKPNRSQIGSDECDAAGSFRVALSGVRQIVVAAFADGLEPVTVEFELEEDERLVRHIFILDEGAIISGTVLAKGGPVSSQTLVRARRADLELVRGEVTAWSNGQVVHRHSRTHTDAQGHFRITGLTAGAYNLTAFPPFSSSLSISSTEASTSVVAPKSGVRLELEYRRVVIEIRAGGKPLDGASVLLGTPVKEELLELVKDESLEGWLMGVGSDGRCSLVFDPSIDYQLQVKRAGYGTELFRMSQAPINAAGVLVVEMAAMHAPAHAFLHVGCDGAPPPEELSIKIKGLGEPFTAQREVRAGPHGFFLEDIPYGNLDVEIRARGPGEVEHYYVPKSILLRVPKSTVVERAVTLEYGGRIQVRATGFDGVLKQPRWFVRDADDRVIRAWLEDTDNWGPGEVRRVRSPLPGGTYTLELTATGFRTWRSAVEIQAGEVKEVEIALVAQ